MTINMQIYGVNTSHRGIVRVAISCSLYPIILSYLKNDKKSKADHIKEKNYHISKVSCFRFLPAKQKEANIIGLVLYNVEIFSV